MTKEAVRRKRPAASCERRRQILLLHTLDQFLPRAGLLLSSSTQKVI